LPAFLEQNFFVFLVLNRVLEFGKSEFVVDGGREGEDDDEGVLDRQ